MNPNLYELMNKLEYMNMFYEIMQVYYESNVYDSSKLIDEGIYMLYEDLPHDMNAFYICPSCFSGYFPKLGLE